MTNILILSLKVLFTNQLDQAYFDKYSTYSSSLCHTIEMTYVAPTGYYALEHNPYANQAYAVNSNTRVGQNYAEMNINYLAYTNSQFDRKWLRGILTNMPPTGVTNAPLMRTNTFKAACPYFYNHFFRMKKINNVP